MSRSPLDDDKSEAKGGEDSTPRAFLSLAGVILECNDAFAHISQKNARVLVGANITSLAKFNDPDALMEAAFKLDHLGDPTSGMDSWRAPLSLGPARKAEDGAALSDSLDSEEEFFIVVSRSSRRINGQRVLEAVLRPFASFTPVSKLHGRNLSLSKLGEETDKDSRGHCSRPVSANLSPVRAFFDEESEPKNLKVLIVEDSPTSLKLMSRMISRLGHQVSTAMNGRDALELLKQESFDIVLMDINMPLMNGLQASHEFRKLEMKNRPPGSKHHQKIIAMSGDISNTLFHEITNAGFDAFIPKPLTEERFHEVLRMPISSDSK